MRDEEPLQRVKVSITPLCLCPPANDEEDIIDTRECDRLRTVGIIRTIELTYSRGMF